MIEHQLDGRPFVVREAIWLFEHDAVSPIIMTVQSDTEVSQRVAVGRRELAITTERRHGVASLSIVGRGTDRSSDCLSEEFGSSQHEIFTRSLSCAQLLHARDDLPPAYSTLRAFVAAARRESVRAAADELGVTPSAVSHQIRILEDWVGRQLFVRAARQIQLTSLGRTLFRRLDAAFCAIAEAAMSARAGARDKSLRISALPLITSNWLVPRLQKFEDLCTKEGAEVAIEIDTKNALADFETDNVDVAIRSTHHRPSANLVSHKLLDLRVVPLCVARVAEKIERPTDLSRVTLIHISARPDMWQKWFAATGMAPVTPRSSISFDTVPSALEAAAAGRGVVLGLDPLVWDAPVAQKLVIPFRAQRVSAGAYFVTYRRRDRSRWAVKRFAEWILGEMQQDKRRLQANSRNASRKQDHAE